jgi:type II secretory pathway pseudopilin PulG
MYFHSRTRRSERGYILLTLLLAMALMAIFAAVIVTDLKFEIRRDREEEMIHRGVQYSRAIRAYYKKFGRYPTKMEDLESANNQRFLRKRYKDPLNCKNGTCADFKLLHFGEVQMSLSGIGGGSIPGANPIGQSGGLSGGPGGLSQPSAFGGNNGFGANSNSPLGQNQQTAGTPPASDPSQAGSQTPPNGTDDGTASNPSATGNSNTGSNQLGSGQIIGGPIVGVASLSPIKDPTIREFNHKKKYRDWVFVYDPAQDQGRLITTPYQPQLQQGFGQQGTPNLNGQNGSNGQPGSGFGNSNGFGNSSGMGNNPSSPNSGGFGQPSPPSNPPPQQQQQQ